MEPGDPLDPMGVLKREELDLLASIAKRAYQSVLNHKIRYLKTGRHVSPLQDLCIASLSFRLPEPADYVKQLTPGPGRLSSAPYELVVFSGENEVLGCREILRIVELFLQECWEAGQRPHFVLLNELSHAFDRLDEMESAWGALARKYETYIVPGTYHSATEFFSVAPIHGPNPTRMENVLKQNSARHQGEIIRTPDSRELFIYETDYGNVVVWICLDVYDPGLVLKFLNVTNRFSGTREGRTRKGREISLVLVPAYSRDTAANIESCIRSLSRFSKTAMVCANSFVADERLESYGFCGGEPLEVVLSKEYPSSVHSARICKACLYSVGLDSLRRLQAESYQENGIFSNPFSTIVNGGPYFFRDAAD